MLHNIYRENASNYVLKRRLTVVGPFSRNKSQMINIVKYIFIISTEDTQKTTPGCETAKNSSNFERKKKSRILLQINLRKSHQISWNLDELLESYRTKNIRLIRVEQKMPKLNNGLKASKSVKHLTNSIILFIVNYVSASIVSPRAMVTSNILWF